MNDSPFDDMVRHIPLGMIVADPAGNIIARNAGAEQIFDHASVDPRAIAQQIGLGALAQQKAPPAPTETTPHVFLGANTLVNRDLHIQRANGTWLTSMVNAAPLYARDGSLIAHIIILANSTAYHAAGQKAQKDQERLDRISESDLVNIACFAADGTITDANAAFLKMTGYTQEDLDSGQLNCDLFTPPEWADRVAQAMETFRTTGTIEPYEREYVRRDGSRFWVIFSAARLGTSTEGISFLADITALKHTEAALRQARDQLEQRVIERTTALARANADLQAEVAERRREEALRKDLMRQLVTTQEDERRRIARGLHDQMGQQLTALSLGLRSLQDSTPPSDATQKQIAHLRALADQLGQEVHRLALDLRPTALDDLGLVAALRMYAVQWSDQTHMAVDFHSSVQDGEIAPSAITSTIYRVVQEAFTNVVKHAQAQRISLILERRGPAIVAIIEDDGCGFDVEAKRKTSNAHQLGLEGMHERVALVGGRLAIESTIGTGTTLFVYIPVTRLPDQDAVHE